MRWLYRLRCLWRRVHRDVVRQPVGGFRCGECGLAGADLGRFGYTDGGFVDGHS